MKLPWNAVSVPCPFATNTPATMMTRMARPSTSSPLLLAQKDSEHEKRHGAAGQNEFRQDGGEIEVQSGVPYGASASRACSAAASAVW